MDVSRHAANYWIKNNAVDVSIKELGGSVTPHFHEFYEIEVILEGGGVYSIDGIDHAVEKGALFFMSPSSCHSIRFTEQTKLINVMFLLDACDPDFLYGLFEATPYIAARISEEDLNFFRTLSEEMTRAASMSYLSAMLNAILGKIKSLCHTPEASVRSTAMQYAVLYIQSHFKENLRLSHVAGIVSYSPNYFGNQFKAYTGMTFKGYVMSLQFALAERLLRYTDYSVTEICYQSGFRDFSNFMFYFKKRNGMSPGAYRERAIQGK